MMNEGEIVGEVGGGGRFGRTDAPLIMINE